MSRELARIAIASVALFLALHACSGSRGPSGPPPPPVVASVDLSPGSAELETGNTVTLTATPRAADGAPLDRAVTWTTSDEAVATVGPTGVVTARGPGTAEVTATAESAHGTATIRVLVAVAAVDVESPAQGMIVGGMVQLQATPRAADGGALDRTVTWESSDEAVATVDGNGLVKGVAPGQVVITASAGAAAGDLVPAEASGTVSLVVTIDWGAFDGNWVGMWTNATFGSMGAITATLSTDVAALEATLLLDVDGPVFGEQDPMPFTVVAPLGPTSIEVDFDAPQHGPIRFTLMPGDFSVSSVNVPADGIDAWDYAGTNTEAAHTADFTVHFTGGGTAVGTVNVLKQ